MVTFSKKSINSLVDSCVIEIKSRKVTAIKMDDYLDNMLKESSGRNEITYPYTINIPRSVDYMLRTGDLSPLQTITIEEPYLYKGSPI